MEIKQQIIFPIQFKRVIYVALEFGPRFRPAPTVATFTNLLLYCIRRKARPRFFLRFSCFSTFGVWALTFPIN